MNPISEKLQLMREQGEYSSGLLEKFLDHITTAEDWDLYRINPYELAKQLGYESREVIDLLIHAAESGLLDFSWSMICPSCGEIQNNDRSLDKLAQQFHCQVCQYPVDVTMDETVEVTFSVMPGIRSLNLDPYSSVENYRKYFFSSSVERSTRMLEYMQQIWHGFEVVDGGETLIIDNEWSRGRSYRMVSAGVHSQFLFHVSSSSGTDQEYYNLDFNNDGITPKEITVTTTNPIFRIRNTRDEAVGLMIVEADFSTLHRIMEEYPSSFKPMLTATDLLGNQKFQDAFKIDHLSPSLKLNIRKLTLLFTDLKGSTELYERTGDIKAYELIQNHFQILGDIVADNSGAVIKTMGDAVMATFTSPYHAIKAGDEMIRAMGALEAEHGSLELKVGVHEGPALAISNRGYLDYFGQTVNIAARIQALAKPGSMWVSEAVMKGHRVKRYLGGQRFRGKRYHASLKGVDERTIVYGLHKSNQTADR